MDEKIRERAASAEVRKYNEAGEDKSAGPVPEEGELINVSGHVQELDRTFGVWSICNMAVMSDNAWAAGGGTLVIALYNGGGPGVMFGLIAATFFYCFIAAALAELSSAMPTSANVYHWASVTAGPKWGRICSFYAGWWNALAWVFGAASVSLSAANAVVAMYELHHPDYLPKNSHVFVAYLGICIIDSALVLFGQRILAKLSNVFGALCILIVFVTILVCAIMPSQTGAGYATNAFVWTDWQNLTGYSSDGFVFLLGMLNGAFAIGTPDGVCHLCEEIPRPRKNIPIGVACQLAAGFLTTFFYYIALFYAVTSLDAVQNSRIISLPLAGIYQQATRSDAGTTGLLFIFFLDVVITVPGAYVTAGRMLWTLGRDEATPIAGFVRKVSPRWRNPFNAQLLVAALITILGLIYIGSVQAFTAFTGVFAIFTTMSYLAAMLPNMLTARKYVKPGPFWIPSPWSYIVYGIASAYIIVFNVIYMFPYALPVDATTMNYSCVMTGGITILLSLWYLWKRTRGYKGPAVLQEAHDDIMEGLVGLTKAEEEERRLRSGLI
ncbi:putative choline transport protein [Polychaeton citri CBS 116435]|uniref:Choline transport protein n=1 Tax=Polychaeton citri CBS 116435 TaxID=1314669 RepID=A0A9P4Q267_9PEZI|nr:putative choline transport protein [Polychaeton citri CBS 116435]